MNKWIGAKDNFRRAHCSSFLSQDIFASGTLMAPPSILCTYHCQPSIKVIIITMCFGRCSEDEMPQSRPHINVQRKRQDNSNKQRVECRVMLTNVVFVHYIAHRLVQTWPPLLGHSISSKCLHYTRRSYALIEESWIRNGCSIRHLGCFHTLLKGPER